MIAEAMRALWALRLISASNNQGISAARLSEVGGLFLMIEIMLRRKLSVTAWYGCA